MMSYWKKFLSDEHCRALRRRIEATRDTVQNKYSIA